MIKFQFFISILTCGMNSLQRYIIHVLETRVPWAIHSDLGGFNCIVCLGDFLGAFYYDHTINQLPSSIQRLPISNISIQDLLFVL